MPSLKLHEVLEQEYVAMYGPLAKGGDSDEKRLANVISKIHERGNRSALCISGGGIRSATFALGIIQGLARAGIVEKFDYLSTVSGGGYIGSWLSSWIRRDEKGVEGVQQALANSDTAAADPNYVQASTQSRRVLPDSKLDPEPEPLKHLRQYSNYLSPRLGLLSGDSWTLAAMYIRNLLLNLLVLIPLLAALLAMPRAFSWLLRVDHVPLASPWVFALAVTFGFGYLGKKRPVDYADSDSDGPAGKKKRLNPDTQFLAFCVLPLTIASVALASTWAFEHLKGYDLSDPWFLAAAVVALAGMTVVPYILYYSRLKAAAVAKRRSGFINEKEFRGYLLQKRLVELVATVISLVTTVVLYFLLAEKVFDDPLRLTPQPARIPPVARFFIESSPQSQLFVCFAVPLLLLVFFVQATIFVGLSSKRNEDADREWWARAGAWLVFAAVAIAVVSAIAVFGPVAFYYAPTLMASAGGIAGVASALLGFNNKTPANQKEKEDAGPMATAGNIGSAIAVPLFVVALLASISLGSTWIIQQFGAGDITPYWQLRAAMQTEFSQTVKVEGGDASISTKSTLAGPLSSLPALRAAAHLKVIQDTTKWQLLIFAIIGAAAVGLSCFIGVNRFSMHALYRNRLIRAYLGASRYRRRPDPFTGFDEDDNLSMWSLRQELLWPTGIRDLAGFIAKLKTDALWQHVDDKTTNDASVLVASLNHLMMTEDFTTFGKTAPSWTTTTENQIGYSRTFINRAILDNEYSDFIRVMHATPNAGKAGADHRAPMHVVNMTLNLTTGDNLAWQQRQAESFTATPLHAGSLRLGYRDAREYAGPKGITLGTAVTISGAAASPNMGYHSSPVMAFLLTFFNIRLGAWLGNPGDAGETSYKSAHPSTNLIPFAKEATGSSNDQSRWVYLSDGGHFENLGLYEMVLRRCHYIVLSDGGADPTFTFEDLGNAIRKIRIDLGVPIDVFDIQMAPRGTDGDFKEGRFYAQATIRYTAIDGPSARDGKLIYIKAGIYKDEELPRDIYNYAKESLLFPHEPTSDQFFSESQFESYRALGRYAVGKLLGATLADTARIPIAQRVHSVEALFRPMPEHRISPQA
jgi:hypothetical protein